MKHLLYIFLTLLSLVFSSRALSQGADCSSADPFCATVGSSPVTFPNATGTTAQSGIDYGCLGSQPNPSWYYMQINNSGTLTIDIDQVSTAGSATDVDFAVWGPFTSPTGGCSNMGAPIDCSFSSASSETATITGAVSGQYYMFLLTNYNGSAGTITFGLNGSSSGDTDCNVLSPTCTMNTMTASVISCASTPFLTFDVGGTITYVDPPTSGSLVVQDCYGATYTVATAPFGTSTNYTITGLPQDGLNCNLTAYFTSDAACTITQGVTAPSPITGFSSNCTIGGGAMDGTITFSSGHAGANLVIEVSDGTTTVTDVIPMPASSPQNWSVTGLNPAANPYTINYYFSDNPSCSQSQTVNCGCSAEGGTGTTTMTGDGINNFILCENDVLDIQTNNDYAFPDDVGPIGGYAYQPGLAYLVYSCAPTPGVFPGSDPCFVGLIPVLDDLMDINDPASYFASLGGAGTFTNNQLYYTPITLYHYDPVLGNYIVNSNCWDIGDISQVTYLNPIQSAVTPDCQTGTVSVQLGGGYPEIFGGNFTASNLSPATASFNNTTCTHGGTIVISGLQNGDMYSFDVTDDNGCPHTISGGPFVGTPTANAGSDDQVCSLTYTLAATPSFGTGTWTGTGTFSNANSPTSSVTVSAAGSYTFTWTENNGGACVDSDDVTVQFSNVQYTDVTNDPTCGNADGDITLSGSNGIPTYTYSIDNGATSQASGAFTSLSSNTYNIVVEDAIGCQATGTITLTDLGGPTINSINANDVSCNGVCDGDIAISATGATQFSINNGTSFSGTNTFNSQCAGTYNIVVQDALGCQTTGNVTINEPPALTHTTAQVDLLCASDCNGQITITENGGTAPYQYSIDNGATNQATGSFSNLCVGTYNILVTDAGGCTTSSTVTLTEPAPLSVTIGITDASCFGMCDGMMNSIPAGGTGAGTYSYTWSPAVGGNVPLVTNLCAGSYSLSITDGNGCTLDTAGIVVGAPQAVSIDNVISVDETCGGDCDGSLTVTSTGGTEFSLDGITFGASNTFTNLCAGTYTVYAQDVNGCSANEQATVVGPSPVQVVANGSTTICIGQSTALTSLASGGVGNYTYSWDNGGTTQNINVTPTGSQTYCVIATDGNGCSSPSACVNVNLHPALSVVALSDQAICAGDGALINAVGSGGNGGPYTYTWDQGVGAGQTQAVSPAFTTVYTVSVSDGCTTPNATASVTITVNSIPNISFSADNFDGCAPVQVNFTENNVPAGSTCLWSFGDGGATTDCSNVSYSFANPGCWDVTLQIITPEGCESSSTVQDYICVYDYPVPDFTFGPQPTTILESTIYFTNLTTGATDYTWTFDTNGSTDQSNQTDPSYTYGDVGAFEVCLDAVSFEGCPAQACDTVYILEEFIVYVPNAFTPDGDAVNNEFMPIISGVIPDSYEFLVFNRWGELIFQSQLVGQGWDGTYKNVMSQEDVYVWKLKVDDQLGETHEYIGHVTLLK
ncbi:MAG: gliding motility-associated C-terminal domain-containing protein [Flavobacteriales bacterium]|nr:gliding motility-associated C-terminal domain-containing protein [Flavobacteriales bacterium]